MPSKEARMQGIATTLILAATLAAGLALGCDGADRSQADARDSATTASCDWYAMCGEIGAGKTYDTRDTCNVQVRAFWDSKWPVATCDGKVDTGALGICLDAIHITECGNAVDVFNTVANKCAVEKVCPSP
jgi:hypothetical protein